MSSKTSRSASASSAGKAAPKCPICGRARPRGEEGERYRPFCSKRCADVDLQRWLSDSYAIPARDDDDSEDEVWSGERRDA